MSRPPTAPPSGPDRRPRTPRRTPRSPPPGRRADRQGSLLGTPSVFGYGAHSRRDAHGVRVGPYAMDTDAPRARGGDQRRDRHGGVIAVGERTRRPVLGGEQPPEEPLAGGPHEH